MDKVPVESNRKTVRRFIFPFFLFSGVAKEAKVETADSNQGFRVSVGFQAGGSGKEASPDVDGNDDGDKLTGKLCKFALNLMNNYERPAEAELTGARDGINF